MRNRDLFQSVVAAMAANIAVLLVATTPARADDRTDADAAFKAEEYEKAEKIYMRLAEAGPRDALIYRNLAICYNQNHRSGAFIDMAEDNYRRALKIDDKDPLTHYRLGQHLRSYVHGTDAIDEFRATARLDPRHVEARYWLARLLQSHNLDAGGESERLYKEVIQLDPGHVEAHYFLAVHYHNAGRTAEALPLFECGGKLKRRGEGMDPAQLEEYRLQILEDLENRRKEKQERIELQKRLEQERKHP